MPSHSRKKRPHVYIAYIYRDDAAGEEQEIEVEVDFDYEGADPSVGIMSGSLSPSGAVRTDTREAITLTKDEVKRITERAEERAAEDAYDAAYEAAESRGDY
jgi:hypothetical protein